MRSSRAKGLHGGGDTGDGFETRVRFDNGVEGVQERGKQPR